MSDYKRGAKDDNSDADETQFIEVDNDSDSKPVLLSSSNNRQFSLDLGNADSKASAGHSNSDERNQDAIQERSVLVVFDLPDGSQGERSFKLGQTVEVLKSFVESEFGIPMMEQNLFFDDGKRLDNPFSLLDYPEFKGTEEVFVRVDGLLPEASKK